MKCKELIGKVHSVIENSNQVLEKVQHMIENLPGQKEDLKYKGIVHPPFA